MQQDPSPPPQQHNTKTKIRGLIEVSHPLRLGPVKGFRVFLRQCTFKIWSQFHSFQLVVRQIILVLHGHDDGRDFSKSAVVEIVGAGWEMGT